MKNRLGTKSHFSGLKLNGEVLLNDHDRANALAREFNAVFIEDDGIIPAYHFEPVAIESDFPHFDALEIYERLVKWPHSYSLTPDRIPFLFIRNVAHTIAYPLSYIFNQSIMFSEIPRLWKHSYVTPLLKKSPSSDPCNYRPISITSIFCRLFEKILKSHMLRHIKANSLIPKSQHGFVSGKSVTTNMLESLNDWSLILDRKKSIDVIYFDFAKAFDRVSHKKLIYKIRKMGFHENICKWLEEFLNGRTFQVRINSSYSDIFVTRSGVPQGGVLSPILFNLFCAELGGIFEDEGVICKQYADDIKIYKEIGSIQDLSGLQAAIDLVSVVKNLADTALSQ